MTTADRRRDPSAGTVEFPIRRDWSYGCRICEPAKEKRYRRTFLGLKSLDVFEISLSVGKIKRNLQATVRIFPRWGVPERGDVDVTISEQLIVEYYSRFPLRI